MANIQFFNEEISFKPKKTRKIKSWILRCAKKEKCLVGEINYIFCSDDYLLSVNQEYLKHNTLTDIITFDNSEIPGQLSGDIFISVERVKENANKFLVSFDEELHRVMIHGVLHLIGYKDKKVNEKALMRKKEEACLSLWA